MNKKFIYGAVALLVAGAVAIGAVRFAIPETVTETEIVEVNTTTTVTEYVTVTVTKEVVPEGFADELQSVSDELEKLQDSIADEAPTVHEHEEIHVHEIQERFRDRCSRFPFFGRFGQCE